MINSKLLGRIFSEWFFLINSGSVMQYENIKYIVPSIFLFIVIIVVSGEIITRVFGATIVYEYNKVLGWQPKRNFARRIKTVDQSGEKYFVEYSANKYGFREFGNLHNNKERIFFVGDSWTGDPNTSDEDAYFGIVKKRLPVEVFAAGGGGYGTLQELLLVKEYARLIKPDIFVLQYCDNDIINNSFFLEGKSITRNQKNLRPYWLDNRIQYRLSANRPYVFLYRKLRLFRTLDGLLSTLQYKIYNGYYPPKYAAYQAYGKDFTKGLPAGLAKKLIAEKAKAVSITQFLMSKMKRVLPAATKLITFSASSDEPEELRIWLSLAQHTGFTPYPSVSMKVEDAEKKGAIVRVHDGAHWNRLGNKIAGKVLAKLIRRDFLQ